MVGIIGGKMLDVEFFEEEEAPGKQFILRPRGI